MKERVMKMQDESFGLIIGAIQGVREILEGYRDEIGAGDLFAACACLEMVEGDLFDRWAITDRRDVFESSEDNTSQGFRLIEKPYREHCVQRGDLAAAQ